MNTQTQTNTQITYTPEQVALILLELRGRVDTIEAQLSKKSLKKTAKPKRSAEEIEAEKLRKAASAEAAKQAKLKKAEEKRLLKETKDEKKRLTKEAKKLEDEKIKAEKKLAAEKVKAEKKLAAEKVKAEKLAAKQAKKLAAKGEVFSKEEYRRQRFLKYRCVGGITAKDPENAFRGINGKFLRIVQKKSDITIVKRDQPYNWTAEAIAHFDSLEDKWNKKSLPFSPDYVAPPQKIKPAKKKAAKKKKSIKKTLVEQTAVIDTDDELEEQPPAEYAVHRELRLGPKSSETTWIKCNNNGSIKILEQNGYIPLDNWAWMRIPGGHPFNNKFYKTNPLASKVGKVIVNCCESSNPVAEEGKDAETVEQADDELEDIEDDDEDLIPDTLDYDSDGYRPFRDGMKITRDNRVFADSDEIKYLGKFDEKKAPGSDIVNDSSEESDDPFGSENEMGDTAVF